MVLNSIMASMTHSTIQNAMKKICLEVPEGASQCHFKNEKILQNRGLSVFLVPGDASHCQTRDHSHSIVAGGLLLTSYVTRLMPRTSLMMRPDTFLSSA